MVEWQLSGWIGKVSFKGSLISQFGVNFALTFKVNYEKNRFHFFIVK